MAKRPKRLSSLEMQALVHEAYAFHFVAMNLGFEADELFAGTAFIANWDPPGLCATVELHAQGKKFIYTLRALVPGDDSRFARFWTEFAAGQPARSRAELDRIVRATHVWKNKATLLGALCDKGFVLPAVEEEEGACGSRPAARAGGARDVN